MHKEQIIIDGVEVLKEKINMCFNLLLNKLETPETIEQTIYEHLDAFVKEWNAQLARKTQIIDDVEEVIKPYQEQIELDAFSLPIAIESILERKTQECEELKIRLMQKDEVDMLFSTPIEGWSSDPCNICESKNNYEQLKQECEELKNIIAYPKYRNEIAIKELENKTKKELIEEIVHCHQIGESTVHCVYAPLREENNRYRKALEEIEKVCIEDTRIFADGTEVRYDSLDKILDIISKADFGKSERSETRLGESCVEPVEPPIIQEAKGEE